MRTNHRRSDNGNVILIFRIASLIAAIVILLFKWAELDDLELPCREHERYMRQIEAVYSIKLPVDS